MAAEAARIGPSAPPIRKPMTSPLDRLTDQLDSLIAFLEKLRESIASSSGYGSSTATDNSSGLIIDQVA